MSSSTARITFTDWTNGTEEDNTTFTLNWDSVDDIKDADCKYRYIEAIRQATEERFRVLIADSAVFPSTFLGYGTHPSSITRVDPISNKNLVNCLTTLQTGINALVPYFIDHTVNDGSFDGVYPANYLEWETDYTYTTGDYVIKEATDGMSIYRCKSTHISSSDSEPVSGTSKDTYWTFFKLLINDSWLPSTTGVIKNWDLSSLKNHLTDPDEDALNLVDASLCLQTDDGFARFLYNARIFLNHLIWVKRTTSTSDTSSKSSFPSTDMFGVSKNRITQDIHTRLMTVTHSATRDYVSGNGTSYVSEDHITSYPPPSDLVSRLNGALTDNWSVSMPATGYDVAWGGAPSDSDGLIWGESGSSRDGGITYQDFSTGDTQYRAMNNLNISEFTGRALSVMSQIGVNIGFPTQAYPIVLAGIYVHDGGYRSSTGGAVAQAYYGASKFTYNVISPINCDYVIIERFVTPLRTSKLPATVTLSSVKSRFSADSFFWYDWPRFAVYAEVKATISPTDLTAPRTRETWLSASQNQGVCHSWVVGKEYGPDYDAWRYVSHNGHLYTALPGNHIATADDEPGVGKNWTTYWGVTDSRCDFTYSIDTTPRGTLSNTWP